MLKVLARAVLSIPASSVSCERIWSAAGRNFSKLRGSLKPENGGQQLFLHELLKVEERIPSLKAKLSVEK